MKNITSLLGFSALTLAVAVSSCKKDETDNLSRVKNYASITLAGDALTSINLNETYTDPGAITTLDGVVVPTVVKGRVDNTKVGFYNISYRGANTEGDTIVVNRVVAVVAPSVNNLDQSGAFLRSGNPVTITKIGKGLYRTSNLGGVASTSTALFPAYFAQTTPTTLVFPEQLVSGLGNVSFSGQSAVFSTAGLVTSFTYTVISPSFLNNARTFVRQ